VKFVFDGYLQKTPEDLIAFLHKLGVPEFILNLQVSDQAAKERFCKKNEVDDIGEEQMAEIQAVTAAEA